MVESHCSMSTTPQWALPFPDPFSSAELEELKRKRQQSGKQAKHQRASLHKPVTANSESGGGLVSHFTKCYSITAN